MSWYWPWNRQGTPSHAPQHAGDGASSPYDPQLAALAASVSQLTTDLSAIRLEWAETLDKINRWASRQAARARREVNGRLAELVDGPATDGPEMAEDAPGATNGAEPAPGSPESRSRLKAALRSRIRR